MKEKPVKSTKPISETSPETIAKLEKENRKFQIQIYNLKTKVFKLETKTMKQEQKIIKLQAENDKLKSPKNRGFIDLSEYEIKS